MTELIPINKADFNGAEINSVNARELHAVLESKYQFADWIKSRLEETDAVENIDYIIVSEKTETMTEHGKKASIRNEYILSTDIAKEIAMLERNEVGKKVRRYFIEFEKAHKQIFIPQDLPTALRAYANEVEQKELALKQRDQALATKAWIGSKREATAMATASAAKREAQKLQIQLDQNEDWATVKKVEFALGGAYDWRKLTATSAELKIERIDVPDKNYGTVKSYHKDVWLKAYGIDITNLDFKKGA
ncbi:antA/AntB antirepressor family protein [Campylobacter concisus]|uniref:antA/AntB antirepressor family protein n=1 Tax=Campylobacter concisus TaxID=199 RepID=UPI000CD81205|nr:antA/AntB antirepressor family protein [Campylobacter concisus]